MKRKTHSCYQTPIAARENRPNPMETTNPMETPRVTEDTPDTPGPGGRFHRFYSVLATDIQRGV